MELPPKDKLGLYGRFFERLNKKGNTIQIPNFRLHKTDPLLYGRQTCFVSFDAREWANISKPRYWVGKPWPPQIVQDLMTADWSECCIGCNSESQCACDASEWRWLQFDTWDTRIELRGLKDGSVGAFSRKRFEPGAVMGEMTGHLVPGNWVFEGAQDLYHVNVAIGHTPKKGRKVQPEARLSDWSAGSWTRFIGHDDRPNACFQEARYGDTRMVMVFAGKRINKDDRITVDFGEGKRGSA